MKIRIKTDAASDPILRHMAHEAGTTVEELAEVAIYNLIALWQADRGVITVADASSDIIVAAPPPECDLPAIQSSNV